MAEVRRLADDLNEWDVLTPERLARHRFLGWRLRPLRRRRSLKGLSKLPIDVHLTADLTSGEINAVLSAQMMRGYSPDYREALHAVSPGYYPSDEEAEHGYLPPTAPDGWRGIERVDDPDPGVQLRCDSCGHTERRKLRAIFEEADMALLAGRRDFYMPRQVRRAT